MSFEPSDIGQYMRKAANGVRSVIRVLREKKVFSGFRITFKVIWNLVLIAIVLGLLGGMFAFGAGAGYFASLVKDQPIMSYDEMKKNIYNYTETSEVYFADNVYLGKLESNLEREKVDLAHISDYVKEALIATEDKYFYKHEGIVPKAVVRAIYQELTNAPIITGGSTLTQQLVKNQILTPEVSFKRKAKEMLFAMRIENFFSKNEILQAYLNVVPFGRNASGDNIAGIQAAAQGVFGVDADELNIPQAAFLAGLPKNPFTYTPFENAGGVKDDISDGVDRMHTVLSRMLSVGFITKEQYKKAMQYDIKKHLAKPKPSPHDKYPYLTTEVRKRAKIIIAKQIAEEQGLDGDKLEHYTTVYDNILYEKNHSCGGSTCLPGGSMEESAKYKGFELGELKKAAEQFEQFKKIADQRIDQNGYKIYTTIDKKVYDAMQKAAHEFDNYEHSKTITVKNSETGEKEKRVYMQQVAGMLIKNDTGAIISFVGGRDFDHLKFNLATQAYRPNGSTMKPLLDYAPGMEAGIVQPGSILADLPTTLNGYTPHNYADYGYGNYHGLVSARKALKYSYNIPAIKTYYKLRRKVSDPTKYLREMGFTSLLGGDRDNLSMAIGTLTKGVTVEENTNAYVTFGNGGKFVDAFMIEKIESSDGQVIYEHEVEPKKIFSPQTNYLMLDMMRSVMDSGTGTNARRYLDFRADWAGKSGTSDSIKDSWFIGTNPNVTLGVWIGYVNNAELIPESHSRRNQQLWAAFANAAHDVRPKLMDPDERFKMPGGIVRRTVCKLTGLLPSKLCSDAGLTISDLFNQKYAPSRSEDVLDKNAYVVIDEKKYLAHERTPEAFTEEGIIVSKDFIEDHFLDVKVEDFFKYLPEEWKDVLTAETLKENGKVPAPVSGVRVSGGNVVWNEQPENDIVGYRVYAAPKGSNSFSPIGSVKVDAALHYPIQTGGAYHYYVTAVDIDGRESGRSAIVKSGDWTPPKPEPKPKPDDGTQDGNTDGTTGGTDSTTDENDGQSNDTQNGDTSTNQNSTTENPAQ
ncbi:MAG TPA: transglycosylase domain-containing protein [Bacillales bacterium]|nr:transglycosylase domain-containing protein [Bacillales bacterium]